MKSHLLLLGPGVPVGCTGSAEMSGALVGEGCTLPPDPRGRSELRQIITISYVNYTQCWRR